MVLQRMPQVLFSQIVMAKRVGRQLEDLELLSFENRGSCNARAAALTKHTQLTLNLSLLSLLSSQSAEGCHNERYVICRLCNTAATEGPNLALDASMLKSSLDERKASNCSSGAGCSQ